MNDLVVGYAKQLVRWRWVIIPLMLALGLTGSYGFKYIAFSGDYREFFSDDNPDLLAHDMLERTYVPFWGAIIARPAGRL